MKISAARKPAVRLLSGLGGILLMSLAINLFIVPARLYSGGILGLCQVVRSILTDFLHLQIPFDIAGLLNLLVNIPLFILAWRNFGRSFVLRTIVCTVAESLFLSVLPIPAQPILDDTLANCLVGGLLMGFSSGIVLTAGCSSGGTDIIGLYLSKKKNNFSVGRFSLIFNVILYTVCLILFDVPTAIYSVICNVFSSLMVDRSHQQAVVMEVLIFTKDKRPELPRYIMEKLERGVTFWEGHGGYTGDELRVLCVCLSKFEMESLQRAVLEIDPNAFFIVKKAARIGGNFTRHLG